MEETTPFFSGPRGLAVKVLNRVDRSDHRLDRMVDRTIRTSELEGRDTALLNELAYGVTRHRRRLDWVLTGFYRGSYPQAIPLVKNAMRVALYQILFLDRIPTSAAVNESVSIVNRLKGKRAAGLVNGVLRSIVRRIDNLTWPKESDQVHHFGVMGSHPDWMVRRWIDRYGADRTRNLLKANNERAPIAMAVDTTRTRRDAVAAMLENEGIPTRPSTILPDVLVAERMPNIGARNVVREGLVTVQDEAAGLVTRLTGIRPDMRIIDLCAAPGGKTIAMARMLERRGSIVAVDRFESKVSRLAEEIDRRDLSEVVDVVEGDARSIEVEPADVVLLDVPCSGLGVIRRKPDIKWKREPTDLIRLAELQRKMIESAARLVRPGGALVYTTCTIEPEENQEVVSSFLRNHPEFSLESAMPYLPESMRDADLVDDEGYLLILPGEFGTDGAFGARLVRDSA